MKSAITATYHDTLNDLKQKIHTAQLKAHLSVNRELLILYWQIGKVILERQEKEGWGAKITRQLSEDLRREFPGSKGFSYTNIKYMRQFAGSYPNLIQIGPPAVGQLKIDEQTERILNIPWSHNRELLDKIHSEEQRLWYAQKTIEEGWSRVVLIHQIESNAYERQAIAEKKSHNFALTLPKAQSDLAENILKDEYNFDFLAVKGKISERNLEKALIDNIIHFILELGAGFAFVGKQYPLNVGGDEFFVDLLFYNLKLRCYVVIELKTDKFQPEYAGKLGFYLAAIDQSLKTEQDNYSIGIVLCKKHNKAVRDLSVTCMTRPIGVSNYAIAEELPEEIKAIEQVERLL